MGFMAFTERAEKAGLVIAVGGSVGTALQRWLPMFSTGSLLPSAPGYTGGRSEKQRHRPSANWLDQQRQDTETDFTYYNPTIQSSTKQEYYNMLHTYKRGRFV